MRNWLHKLRLAACCFPGRSPLPSHGTIFYLESLINCFISCFDLLWQEGLARPQTNLTARHKYSSNAAFSQLELKKVWSCHGWQQILMTEVHVIAITLPYRQVFHWPNIPAGETSLQPLFILVHHHQSVTKHEFVQFWWKQLTPPRRSCFQPRVPLMIGWFVSGTTQKLLSGFLQNLDRGWVRTENRLH